MRVHVLTAFAGAVVVAYLFYLPFDHWGYLRFLLPALPIAMLLSADALVWLSSRLGVAASVCGVAAVTVLAVMHGVHRARWDGFFANADADQRYADAGVYIDSMTPPRAVVLAMQHSGSVRFYSGRATLRYDLLDPAWLDRAIDHLEVLGFRTYALLEDWEEEVFRQRFGREAARALGGGPLAVRRSCRWGVATLCAERQIDQEGRCFTADASHIAVRLHSAVAAICLRNRSAAGPVNRRKKEEGRRKKVN